jgi:TPR repeat protein
MYRMGMGVPVDNARAYMWFNLAAAQELPGAAVQRDVVLRSLSPAQVLEAQADARRLNAAGTESSATAR